MRQQRGNSGAALKKCFAAPISAPEPKNAGKHRAAMSQAAKPQKVLRVFGREIPMPASRIGRITVGVLLILGGMVGFLPILGFWMIPLGLFVLSQDLPAVRRQRRKLAVWWEKRRGRRRPKDA
jgi:hypothetical protein